MGKRGKDKRTEENRKRFHDMINHMIHNERLAFVIIDGETTDYIISSHGILYKKYDDKRKINIVRPFIDKDLHVRVSLNLPGKRCVKKYMHVLVAEAFVINPYNKPYVHHIDGDPLNNEYTNLMWVTKEEHDILTADLNQYIGQRGSNNAVSIYSNEQIEEVCKLIEENELYPDEICEKTGISYSTFQHLRLRPESWDYIKNKYDLSHYNKFRRLKYTKEQFDTFVKLRKENPDLSLKNISKILDIKYDTIKNWNIRNKIYNCE